MKGNGASVLFGAISVNQYIKLLDVSKNNISDSAGAAIVSSIRNNTSLTELNLDNNLLSSGLEGLGSELKFNKSLKSLYLK
jgi:hypothetical protein